MGVCDLQTGCGMLRKSVSRLREAWDATSETWDDATRRSFARERLDPLLPPLGLLLAAVEKFALALGEAERACRDDQNPSEVSAPSDE
ncbi:MAG: hypothetical protein FJ297_14585 [Planctomycetes bacterium]|nr:hypothetical protein [Planctomycetota bacterium]